MPYLGVLFKEVRNFTRVFAMAVHAHVQRFNAPEYQESIMGAADRSATVLYKFDLLSYCRIIAYRRSQHYIRMTAEVFGGRMNYDIGAHFEWSLQIRRCKSIVNTEEDIPSCNRLFHRGNVNN